MGRFFKFTLNIKKLANIKQELYHEFMISTIKMINQNIPNILLVIHFQQCNKWGSNPQPSNRHRAFSPKPVSYTLNLNPRPCYHQSMPQPTSDRSTIQCTYDIRTVNKRDRCSGRCLFFCLHILLKIFTFLIFNIQR